ncbi:MAG TPA: ABC transporter permease [Gemmatimonadaceae bacterium]|nr:ABC transporter permease [Gemmatimonadaceae bacterium]
MTNPGPPRIARAILAAATPESDCPWLLGDLDELYAARYRQQGRRLADAWYRGQVVRSVPRLLVRRVQTVLPGDRPMQPVLPRQEAFTSALHALRYAFRRLVREPGFTLASVLTLALGLGGNVAVFAVVEAVLLRPLPFAHAERLMIVNHRDTRTGITKEFVPVADYLDIAARQRSFDAIGAYGTNAATVYGDNEPYRARAFFASDGALTALDFHPAFGRSIEPADLVPGAAPVVMLGYEYWRDRMGGDKAILGRSIRVNQTMRTIIGVAPGEFRFRASEPFELLMPMVSMPQASARRNGFTFVIARLAPGKTMADAQSDLTRIAQQLEHEYPESNLAARFVGASLRDVLVGNVKPALILLLSAVGVVLLIACVNVANLLLARSLARRREMAVRMALGAGRARLAVQLITESLALALVAAAVGLLFAIWGSKALVALVPRSVEAPGLSDVHINGAVLAFALGITMLTTLAFGLVAMLTVRLDGAASVLVGAGRTSNAAGVRRVASGLVVAEVALAVVLLVGAGLIMRTFSGLLSVDPGFRYDDVMTMTVGIPADRYRDTVARLGYYRTASAALRAVPGVTDVGQAAVIPLTGNNWTVPFERVEHPVPDGERPPEVGWQVATGSFFTALRIPLLAGRMFGASDVPGGPRVVIVSDAIAKRYFPGENPIGKHLIFGSGSPRRTMEVVGVVGDIRRAGLRDDPRPDMYFAAEQDPPLQTTWFVRTAGEPTKALASLQNALKSIDAKTVFIESASLADVATESVRTTKLVLWLLGVFAVVAVALAAVGIYGVMSYVVRQRTREIGTRIALGATRIDIVWLVMREGVVIAASGALIGLAVGTAATGALRSILFEVSASDPLTLGAATLVLFGAVLAACYVPARRAASVDPARTLAEQ